jgi:hypothetical protein
MTSDLGGTYTYWTDGGGTVLAYNHIHDVHCPGYGGSGIYIDNGSANFVVRHNLCTGNQLAGIHVNTPVRNTLVCHNTTAGNVFALINGGGSRTLPPDFVVANNIFLDRVKVKTGGTLLHNFTNGTPGFVDGQAGDFRLTAGSPCIDAAVPLEGISVPHGGASPDQGCFEYGHPAWSAGSTLPRELWDDSGW